MVMEVANSEYAFACRMDNIKEAAEGNRVISGCGVTAQGTPDMTVDIAAGVVRIDNAYMTISLVDNQAVTAADGTNDRWDIIAVGKDGTVDYTAGTAAANPMPPDLPADHILLALIFVENNSSTVESADIKDNRIIYEDSGVQCPIGSIISWAKSITGMPSLPTGWIECDGVGNITDAESPLNGQPVPDLNTTQRFLRGASTSGTTGGADTHTHLASFTADDGSPGHVCGGNSAAGSSLPAYYQVVFIIRIK